MAWGHGGGGVAAGRLGRQAGETRAPPSHLPSHVFSAAACVSACSLSCPVLLLLLCVPWCQASWAGWGRDGGGAFQSFYEKKRKEKQAGKKGMGGRKNIYNS